MQRPALQRLQDEHVQRSLQQLNSILVFCGRCHLDVDILLPWKETVYIHTAFAVSAKQIGWRNRTRGRRISRSENVSAQQNPIFVECKGARIFSPEIPGFLRPNTGFSAQIIFSRCTPTEQRYNRPQFKSMCGVRCESGPHFQESGSQRRQGGLVMFYPRSASFSGRMFLLACAVWLSYPAAQGEITINKAYPIVSQTGAVSLSAPTVVPTGQCSERVKITSIVPGATVHVYLVATKSGPVSPKKLIGGPIALPVTA
jgi:hypothetical protein